MDWNTSFAEQLGQATDMVRSGRLAEATQAIQQALAGGGAAFAAAAAAPVATATPQPKHTPKAKAAWRTSAADVQDAVVIEPGAPRTARAQSTPQTPRSAKANTSTSTSSLKDIQEKASETARAALDALAGFANGSPLGDAVKARTARKPKTKPAPQAKAPGTVVPELPGSFDHVAMEHAGVPHSYRLYVPPVAAKGQPMPLVLMLHGCTQNPDDFATGTGMNQAAADAGALVLYPAQLRHANPNACWNWFTPENQLRDSGELALLVDMVKDVIARHPVDTRRIYVAGLSAGGAMASLLAREYPELFAAVGVHSGLQAGAAHTMMGALSAMKSGAKGVTAPAVAAKPGDVPALIVFHGDADSTVSPRNGDQLIEAAVHQLGNTAVERETQQGQSPAGQPYTRTLFHAPGAKAKDDANDVRVEQWVLHGAGHAWSGGAAHGSHTDPHGVNATREMLRFFLEHPKTAH